MTHSLSLYSYTSDAGRLYRRRSAGRGEDTVQLLCVDGNLMSGCGYDLHVAAYDGGEWVCCVCEHVVSGLCFIRRCCVLSEYRL